MYRKIAQCMSWCLENDIKIYPIIWKEANPEKPPRLAIQVNYQGFKRTGDIVWSQKNKKEREAMYDRINSLYCDYYQKR
tara:strand:+ start:1005 stop:1241 length:237 start_codon:yes stop_codon:yes gene_type:complete